MRDGNSIDERLFTNAEAAIYTMEWQLHSANLKMIYNNVQIYTSSLSSLRSVHKTSTQITWILNKIQDTYEIDQ
jgi:Tfp pilus assembly protein PilX